MERLLSKKQVKEIVGFSPAHIDRMEFEDDYAHLGFPRRVKIGFRVFWVASEINDWVAERIATR